MHLSILVAQLLGASLVSAYAITPAGSVESIDVHSDYHDIEVHRQHVQMLYNSMGGTFKFMSEDGNTSAITSMHLYKDANNYPRSNDTRFSHDSSSLDERSFALDTRAPIKYDGRVCAQYAQYGDYGISYDAQRNIDAKFCAFLSGVQPSFWGVVGLGASSLACGTLASPAIYVCQGIWTVSTAVAGQYLGPAIQKYCDASFDKLDEVCGKIGGQQTLTVGGEKVLEEAFATTEKGDDCDPSDEKGGSKCETITCHNKDCS